MKLGKLYGVGTGPGDPGYLTLRAAELLRCADVIFTVISPNAKFSISRSVVESQKPRGVIRQLIFSMSRDRAAREAQVRANAEEIMSEIRRGKDCVFATLGDTMTYSTFGYIMEIVRSELPEVEIEIVPGVTSFAALAARAKCVLVENGEELRIVPSFRTDRASSLELEPNTSTILLKTYHSRKALLERLQQEEGVSVLYGEMLTMDGEFITSDTQAMLDRPEEYLSLMLVKKK